MFSRVALVFASVSMSILSLPSLAAAGPGTVKPGYLNCWAEGGQFHIRASAPVYANDASQQETRYYLPYLWRLDENAGRWMRVADTASSYWSNGETADGQTLREETIWTETRSGQVESALPLHHTWARSEGGQYFVQQLVIDRRRETQQDLRAEAKDDPEIRTCNFN
jgi:hypothetical protein